VVVSDSICIIQLVMVFSSNAERASSICAYLVCQFICLGMEVATLLDLNPHQPCILSVHGAAVLGASLCRGIGYDTQLAITGADMCRVAAQSKSLNSLVTSLQNRLIALILQVLFLQPYMCQIRQTRNAQQALI